MEVVLGPPGTGKTTYLLNQMERELDRGTPPDRIGFVSFTRRAAQEAMDRAKIKFGLKNKDLPWVRTLHSLCFRALGLSSSQVLEGKKFQEFGEYIGVNISGYFSLEEGSSFGFAFGDRCLFMDNLARVRCISLREQYDDNRDGMLWQDIDYVSRGLVDFKKANALFDYTDMLSTFVQMEPFIHLDVLFVDESQDLSQLQWRVVDHLRKSAKRVVVAGDDDQAIYRWAGADIEHFIKMSGNVIVLDHSWRVPKEIQEVAMKILSRVENRREKRWEAREGTGAIERIGDMDDIEFDINEDTLILSRNSCFLRDEAIPVLEKAGLLYEYKNKSAVKHERIAAIRNWEKLRKGGEILVSEAAEIYEEMDANKGYKWGQKKLPAYKDRDQLVTIQDLQEAGGLITTDIWHEALTKISPAERVYITAVLQSGQRLTKQSNLRLSTIHSAKGAQADHVILFTDMARRSHLEAERLPEDEARTWYVATTRAKQKLTIISPQVSIQRAYDF